MDAESRELTQLRHSFHCLKHNNQWIEAQSVCVCVLNQRADSLAVTISDLQKQRH
jgi:hypothetical protein